MHPIAMQSLPFVLNNILLYRQSNPILPLSGFDPAAITAEKDVIIPRCHDFGSSVCFGLRQFNNAVQYSVSAGCRCGRYR